MRKSFVWSLVALSVFAAAGAVSASRQSMRLSAPKSQTGERVRSKTASTRYAGGIAAQSYRSPVAWHKTVVSADDRDSIAEAAALGARELADYGSFRLMAIEQPALEMAAARQADKTTEANFNVQISNQLPRFEVRDDYNVLLLRSGTIDTTSDDAPGTLMTQAAGLLTSQATGESASETASHRANSAPVEDSPLRLIQFIGPVKHDWLNQLIASGLEPIAYVPNNGYLVRGSASARAKLLARSSATDEPFIQWEGPFRIQYKIHPALTDAMNEGSSEVLVGVQIATGSKRVDNRTNSDVKSVRKLATEILIDAYPVLNFTNIRMRIPAARISELASIPGVVNIEPWSPPAPQDERAAQIDAAELTPDLKQAKGPGYMSWLAAHGFTSRFGFAIDFADTGLDRGSTASDKLHPDFLDASRQSRVAYARDYTSELDASDTEGHGTINASIAAGSNLSSDSRDASGYGYGIGVAPFALIGMSRIFQSNGRFDLVEPFTHLVSDAYRDGARVSSNSWGSPANEYSLEAQEYDSLVRDASPSQPGNQEISIVFSAGNLGPGKTVTTPATGKNVMAVAASENARKDGTDGCNVKDTDADSAMDIAFFSSGGPLNDLRIKPDIAAPGTHVQGAASQNPNFDGTGICGQDLDQPFFPAGQTLYTWSSGTSHSAPQVAGAAALVRQFFTNQGEQPSAALIKASLLGTTTFMTGQGTSGDLPNPRQGWGLLNLGRTFDSTPKIFVNQTTTFSDSGQDFVMTGEVKDSTQPFRVMLAWTDAPGFSAFAPWVNDLDLEVTINGQLYRGNNFVGQESQPGGVADSKNNVEGVWLPAGTVGTFVIRVRASNIAGDGVPGNGDTTDQDFALVVYNGERRDVPVASFSTVTLAGGVDAFADPGETVSMRVSIVDASPIALNGGHGTLTSKTTGVTVGAGATDFPNIASGQTAEGQTAFSFTVDRSVACGTPMQFVLDVAGAGFLSRIPLTIIVGNKQSVDLFSDDVESGGVKWTHASALKKKKKKLPIDTWSISTTRVHSGSNAWFSADPGSVADAHLDTVPIQLPSDAQTLQLVFYHTFEFEPGTFDGGVLEISTGGDFEDLGSKIVRGKYTGTIYPFLDNPIAGRQAWVEGRLGALQQVVVDLSSYSGKTVVIRFRMGSDSSAKGLGWYIDDVTLRGDRSICSPPSL
jgi:subtilase family protein